LNRFQWWFWVLLSVFFLVIGQTAAILLGRFYYDQGGSSTIMATLVKTAGFPILFIPLIFLPASKSSPTPSNNSLSEKSIYLIYIGLGTLFAGNSLLYSYGLLYLSASTFSLTCATQLAFNAIFAYFINSQKITPLILNFVVILSYSAALLGVTGSSDTSAVVLTKSKYAIGFVYTLAASAIYSLLLSLMQFTFQK
ncbi:putative purine permease 13, partial [Bienertia sinuspersici]